MQKFLVINLCWRFIYLSLSLISPSLSISLPLPFFLSLSFSLSFSLAYLMDVFVLVIITIDLISFRYITRTIHRKKETFRERDREKKIDREREKGRGKVRETICLSKSSKKISEFSNDYVIIWVNLLKHFPQKYSFCGHKETFELFMAFPKSMNIA